MSDNPNVLTFPHVPFDGLWLWARNTLSVPRDKFTLNHVRLWQLSPDYCPMHRTGTELGRYMIRYSNHRYGFGLRVHIRVTRHYKPAPPGKLLRNAPWCCIRNTGVALRVTRVAKLGGSATGLSVGATDRRWCNWALRRRD